MLVAYFCLSLIMCSFFCVSRMTCKKQNGRWCQWCARWNGGETWGTCRFWDTLFLFLRYFFFLHLSLMPFLFDILLFKKRLAPWTNTAGRKHGHTKQKSKSGGWRSWRRKGDETDKERRAGGNSKSLSGRELHHLIMGFAQSTAVVALNFPVRIWGGGVNNRWFLFLGA